MAAAMSEFEATQADHLAEQQALLESFESKHGVEGNCRFLRQRAAEIDEIFISSSEENKLAGRPASNGNPVWLCVAVDALTSNVLCHSHPV